MLKVLKYLKKTWISVIVIVALLCVQAAADLALPDYTSKIVNIGIQQGGIDTAIPEAISKDEMDNLLMFTNDDSKILDCYKLVSKDTVSNDEYNNYLKEYPALENEEVYVLNKLNKDQKYNLEEMLKKPLVQVYLMQNDQMQEKIKESCLQKYGVPNPAQRHIKNIELWNDDQYIIEHFINPDKTIKYREMMTFFDCPRTSGIRQRLKTMGIEYKPYTGYSRFEVEIKEFIQSINPTTTIVERNRTIIKPYEIDLFLPEHSLGIEFHGLIWHSFGYQPNNAELEQTNKHLHKAKADLAESKNINLLQIFENEWHNPTTQKVWKSIISAKMKKNNKIHSKECVIREISHTEAMEFIQDNHLQQPVVGMTTNIALQYQDKTVSVMTFGLPRFAAEGCELIRFCPLLNYTIVDGFSTMLKYFIETKNPTSIIAYANRRWDQGNTYSKNGFVLSEKIKPKYFYLHSSDTTELKHRVDFAKHKLQGILEKFDPELTETQNMYENGYRKIYDAGHLRFVLEL